MSDREELITLRVSVARVAQALNINGRTLKVLGQNYHELRSLAAHNERGWNDLAGACVSEADTLRRRAW